jgi:hypothetical protein
VSAFAAARAWSSDVTAPPPQHLGFDDVDDEDVDRIGQIGRKWAGRRRIQDDDRAEFPRARCGGRVDRFRCLVLEDEDSRAGERIDGDLLGRDVQVRSRYGGPAVIAVIIKDATLIPDEAASTARKDD